MSKQRWYWPITIVFVFMGILLSFQYQAQSRFSGDLSMQRTESLIAMVRDLSDKRMRLNLEISDLYKKLNDQTQSYEDQSKLEASLKAEIEKLNIVTGATKVQGPGLTITIEQYMPILYIDIIYIVNELWAAGAEAIAVNDQRITAHSSIFYIDDENGMSITVNNQKLDYPIVISAIGDPNNLEKGLTIPGGIIDNLSVFRAFPRLEKSDSLTIPALSVPPVFLFMNEYIPPPTPPENSNPSNTNPQPS